MREGGWVGPTRLCFLAAVGCADDPSQERAIVRVETGEPALGFVCEIGTGTDEFVPLQDGDEVEILAGPQGGYHIFTSARLRRGDGSTCERRPRW